MNKKPDIVIEIKTDIEVPRTIARLLAEAITGATVNSVIATPKPSPKTEKFALEREDAPKPKKSMATRTGNYRRLPSEVLDACRIIKRKADKKGLDIVQFIKTPDLCEKKLKIEPSQSVKKYFLEWSKTASDASIRYRLGLPDVDTDGNKTKRGGK